MQARTGAYGATTACIVACVVLCAATSVASAAFRNGATHDGADSGMQLPVGQRVNVFNKGESGYFCLKIPYVLTTANGTILAFSEARTGGCGDYDPTTLVVKRSVDGGGSWGPLGKLYEGHLQHPTVVGNAAPVQVSSTGRILVPFCMNNSRVFITHSDDDGLTWVPPAEITSTASRSGWNWVGLGPPGAIELQPSGRIVIPAYHGPHHWDDGTITHCHIVYSDDKGSTWNIGAVFDNTTDKFLSNEAQAVQLRNGSVLLNARGLGLVRCQAISDDGGLTFTPMRAVDAMPQPMDGVEGSIVMHPPTGYLFFTNTHEGNWLGLRYNLTLQVSKDSGATWEPLVVIDRGECAYSALTVSPSGDVGLLYEWANSTQFLFVPDHISYEVVYRDGAIPPPPPEPSLRSTSVRVVADE